MIPAEEIQVRLLEERVKTLETAVSALRENNAALKTLVDVIHTDLKDIKTAMIDLTASMNRGKGGLATLLTVTTMVGSFLGWLFAQVSQK